MDDRQRARIETEAAAMFEWGHASEQIVASSVQLGATPEEAERIIAKLAAARSQHRLFKSKVGAAGAVLLMLFGVIAIVANQLLARHIWGPGASTAQHGPPREGIGQLEFVAAYLFGDSGFQVGTYSIIVGVAALGYFLSGILHERRHAPR